MKNDQLDYEALRRKALSQLKSRQSLFGKDGAFAPMLKEFLETALEEELGPNWMMGNANQAIVRMEVKQAIKDFSGTDRAINLSRQKWAFCEGSEGCQRAAEADESKAEVAVKMLKRV